MAEEATSIYLQQWHQGDQKALDSLIERHLAWIHEKVRGRLGGLLREKGETCDYVQDAVIQFMYPGSCILSKCSSQSFTGLDWASPDPGAEGALGGVLTSRF